MQGSTIVIPLEIQQVILEQLHQGITKFKVTNKRIGVVVQPIETSREVNQKVWYVAKSDYKE